MTAHIIVNLILAFLSGASLMLNIVVGILAYNGFFKSSEKN